VVEEIFLGLGCVRIAWDGEAEGGERERGGGRKRGMSEGEGRKERERRGIQEDGEERS
jgi:hypothetical protein